MRPIAVDSRMQVAVLGDVSGRSRRGFTLIELMVVVAIIVMAAGLMIPSLADFFRNKALDGVRQQFTSALNSARLHAVVNSRPFHVVFFREGVRIYDVTRKNWKAGEEFNPHTAPAASEKVHYDLVFAGMHSGCFHVAGSNECTFADDHDSCVDGTCEVVTDCLPRYEDWWWMVTEGTPASRAKGEKKDPATSGFSSQGLVAIQYARDGTMSFVIPSEVYVYDPAAEKGSRGDFDYHPPISLSVPARKGNDVPAGLYKKEPPDSADFIIWQKGNSEACFVDLQMTGAVDSKLTSAEKLLPAVEEY